VNDDDDHARRLLRENWPGEDDLVLVREKGDRMVRVPDQPQDWHYADDRNVVD
jgi:hypothetical protein